MDSSETARPICHSASGSRCSSGVVGGAPTGRDPEARRIEDQLRRYLQTDVHLSVGAKQRGEIRIMFYSNDDLERVLELVLGTTEDGL